MRPVGGFWRTSAVILLIACWCCVTSVCQGSKLRYGIAEEMPAGTVIGSLQKDIDLSARYQPDVLHRIRFHLVTKDSHLIAINATSLYTLQSLDRESICSADRNEACVISCDVLVLPLAYFHITQVSIEIIDINDNAPKFPVDGITLKALESLAVGAEFYVPAAVDLDSAEFGIARYELLLPSDDFELIERRSPGGSTNIRLRLTRKLAWLRQRRYEGQIVAYDGGSPPRTGKLSLTILVVDTDDHVPEFEKSIYNISVVENFDVPKTLVRVFAEDPDSGLYGTIVYGLLEETLSRYSHVFAINNATGELTAIVNLDYEVEPTHYLTVTARDMGPSMQISEAVVIINVLDINDNAPNIVAHSLQSLNVTIATVEENAAVESFVAIIEVNDRDSGKNGEVSCSLNTTDFALRWAYGSTYKLVTNRMFDRELTTEVSLQVRCHDYGMPSLLSLLNLTVVISDVNDNFPIFKQNSYEADVTENELPGVILQITATDRDVGINGQIEYLLHAATSHFAIDRTTGTLSTTQPLDREAASSITLRVVARDSGTPRLTSVATVVINVVDVNDELPFFVHSAFNFTIAENLEMGLNFDNLSIVDRDGPPFNAYVVTLPAEVLAFFSVDPTSGMLIALQAFDREEREYYRFMVTVHDAGLGVIGANGTALVEVHVLDVNDNPPVILLPTASRSDVAFVSEKLPVGALAVEVKVSDADIGVNAQSELSLVSSADCFVLDSRSSSVVVSRSLYSPLCRSDSGLLLSLTAVDIGNAAFVTQRNVTVYVNQTSDPESLFAPFNTSAVVFFLAAIFIILIILIVAMLIVHMRRNMYRYSVAPGQARGCVAGCISCGCLTRNGGTLQENSKRRQPTIVRSSLFCHTEKVKQTPEKAPPMPRSRDLTASTESSIPSDPSRESWPSSINFSFLKWPLAWSTRLPGSSTYEFPSPTSASSDHLLDDVEKSGGGVVCRRSNLKQRTSTAGAAIQSSTMETVDTDIGKRVFGQSRSVRFTMPSEVERADDDVLDNSEMPMMTDEDAEMMAEVGVQPIPGTLSTFSPHQPMCRSTPRSPSVLSTGSDAIDGTLVDLMPQRLTLNTAFMECSDTSSSGDEAKQQRGNKCTSPPVDKSRVRWQHVIDVDVVNQACVEEEEELAIAPSPVALMFSQAPSALLSLQSPFSTNRQLAVSPLAAASNQLSGSSGLSSNQIHHRASPMLLVRESANQGIACRSPLTVGHQPTNQLQTFFAPRSTTPRLLSNSNIRLAEGEAGSDTASSNGEQDEFLVYSCTDIEAALGSGQTPGVATVGLTTASTRCHTGAAPLPPTTAAAAADVSNSDSGVTKGTGSSPSDGSGGSADKKNIVSSSGVQNSDSASLSGASSVDAAEVCDEIHRLFFEDYV